MLRNFKRHKKIAAAKRFLTIFTALERMLDHSFEIQTTIDQRIFFLTVK